MVAVILHGGLKQALGRETWWFDVHSVGEAIRALEANTCRAFRYLLGDKAHRYQIIVDDTPVIHETQLYMPKVGMKTVHLIPVLEGAGMGEWFLVAGAALVGIALVMAGQSWALSFITPGFVGMLGATLMLGGLSQIFMKTPTTDTEGGETEASYLMDGTINVYRQGGPVPVGYGQLRVGSQLIQAGLRTMDVNTDMIPASSTVVAGEVEVSCATFKLTWRITSNALISCIKIFKWNWTTSIYELDTSFGTAGVYASDVRESEDVSKPFIRDAKYKVVVYIDRNGVDIEDGSIAELTAPAITVEALMCMFQERWLTAAYMYYYGVIETKNIYLMSQIGQPATPVPPPIEWDTGVYYPTSGTNSPDHEDGYFAIGATDYAKQKQYLELILNTFATGTKSYGGVFYQSIQEVILKTFTPAAYDAELGDHSFRRITQKGFSSGTIPTFLGIYGTADFDYHYEDMEGLDFVGLGTAVAATEVACREAAQNIARHLCALQAMVIQPRLVNETTVGNGEWICQPSTIYALTATHSATLALNWAALDEYWEDSASWVVNQALDLFPGASVLTYKYYQPEYSPPADTSYASIIGFSRYKIGVDFTGVSTGGRFAIYQEQVGRIRTAVWFGQSDISNQDKNHMAYFARPNMEAGDVSDWEGDAVDPVPLVLDTLETSEFGNALNLSGSTIYLSSTYYGNLDIADCLPDLRAKEDVAAGWSLSNGIMQGSAVSGNTCCPVKMIVIKSSAPGKGEWQYTL